jgi:metal-responsive CopG/Arc/MetJ family transcriptional regulator
MSTQITVHLPDEMVARLDQLVANGQAPSRASVIEQALTRELRRLITLGRQIGYFLGGQEAALTAAIRAAFDLG